MAKMSEREFSFELVEKILDWIREQPEHGSVLVFLPGWNHIFALQKYLQQHPIYGLSRIYYVFRISKSAMFSMEIRPKWWTYPFVQWFTDYCRRSWLLVVTSPQSDPKRRTEESFCTRSRGFHQSYSGYQYRRNQYHNQRLYLCYWSVQGENHAYLWTLTVSFSLHGQNAMFDF